MDVVDLSASAQFATTTFSRTKLQSLVQELAGLVGQARSPQQIQQAEGVLAKLRQAQANIPLSRLTPSQHEALRQIGAHDLFSAAFATTLNAAIAENAINPTATQVALNHLADRIGTVHSKATALAKSLSELPLSERKLELAKDEAIIELTFRDAVSMSSLQEMSSESATWDQVFDHLALFGPAFTKRPQIVHVEDGSLRVWLSANKDVVLTLSTALVALATIMERAVVITKMFDQGEETQLLSDETLSSLRNDIARIHERAVKKAADDLREHIDSQLDEHRRREAENAATNIAEELLRFTVRGGVIEFSDPLQITAGDTNPNGVATASGRSEALSASAPTLRRLLPPVEDDGKSSSE